MSESAKNKTETKEGHHPYEKADVGWAFVFTKSAGSKRLLGNSQLKLKIKRKSVVFMKYNWS